MSNTLSKLPIAFDFKFGELFNSWEQRVFEANLYDDKKSFEDAFCDGQSVKSDGFGFTREILLATGFDGRQAEIYLKHSLYPFFAMFYCKEEQAQVLKIQRCGYDENDIDFKHSEIKEYRYCPLCAESETVPYLHRAHQLPYVKSCYKHYCALKTIESSEDGKIIIPRNQKYGPSKESDDIFYAIFISELLMEPFDMERDDLITMMAWRLRDLEIVDTDDVLDHFETEGYEISELNAKRLLANPLELSKDFFIKNLKVIFGNYNYFKELYKKHIKPYKNTSLPDDLKDKGYSLISPYKENLIELKHETCGQSFLTNEYGLKELNIICPDCEDNN